MKRIMLLVALTSLFWVNPIFANEWVKVDSARSGWQVSGGAVHHETYEKNRADAALCIDCHWWIHLICESWSDENHGWCPSMRLRCPRDMSLVEVFRANADVRPNFGDKAWVRTGYSCVGDAGPISYGEIFSRIRESKWLEPPVLQVQTSPPGITIVNLKTKLKFKSTSEMPTRSFTIADQPVKFSAIGTRSFECGSCFHLSQNEMVWRAKGTDTVKAKTRWSGTIEVSGLTLELDLPPVYQSRNLSLQINPLHRKLI